MCLKTSSPNLIENTINILEQGIPNSKVTVSDLTGSSNHLGVTVVSDVFEGMMLIKQHQLIMDLLKESLKSDLHAVKVKTMTTKQAEKFDII